MHSDNFTALHFSVSALNIKATCHKGQCFFFLDAFTKLREATNCFVMFVRLSVQLVSHWTDIHEI